MMTKEKLAELEFLANKVLEGHHVRTGYDLAPIILELVAEVRELNNTLDQVFDEIHEQERYR
jgi:hypothetical protein